MKKTKNRSGLIAAPTDEEISLLESQPQRPYVPLGYISSDYVPYGTCKGDWIVVIDGKTTEYKVQRASDVLGFYEHVTREPIKNMAMLKGLEYTKTHHVKANVRFRYVGNSSIYSHYKQ